MGLKTKMHNAVSMIPIRKVPAKVTTEAADATPGTQGVFVTPQSLVTFPVASFIVMVIWKVLSALIPSFEESKIVPAVIALIIGIFIYVISFSEQATVKDKIIGIVIAIINSFLLAASVLGIDAAIPT